MPLSIKDRVDKTIKDIESKFPNGLSNTSTKKFDDLVAAIADLTRYSVDDIYPTSVVARPSNVWNRLSQGKPLNRHYSLAVVVGGKGDDGAILSPMKSFIGDGFVHYDSVAVVTPDKDGFWGISSVATNAKDDCSIKIRDEYPSTPIYLYNMVSSAIPEVVRLGFFSNLEAKFTEWLPKNGVGAPDKYISHLKAISEPQAAHTPSGKWPGFYQDLIGTVPAKKVFEVIGESDFNNTYAAIIPFFDAEWDDRNSLSYSAPNFNAMFDFMHASASRTEVVEQDQLFTRSSFRKYREFLHLLEEDLSNELNNVKTSANIGSEPRQKITYGAPGTGKSWRTNKLVEDGQVQCFRTTFHPDSDYSTFVGAYKPTKNTTGLTYEFVPQTFVKAYKAAWLDMTKPVVLVIEEINRGNCAQIFGDLFQLLDRKDDGYSAYPIDADSDLESHLSASFANASITDAEVKSGKKLILPPNLYIWATMNTSDQSLFPIDSAFKRRWDWEYVPISNPHDKDPNFTERKVVVGTNKYNWWKFITKVNDCILDVIKSEDKQLGYFFVKAPDVTGEITAKQFVNKVLFYLFNDVFKDYALPDAIFGKQNGGNKYAFKDFFVSDGSVNESTLTQYFGDLGIEAE